MRHFLAALALTVGAPAAAMNWEGHDDWMADNPLAGEYRAAVPLAAPPPTLPPRDCTAGRVPDNPYEQVPAGKAACGDSRASPGR